MVVNSGSSAADVERVQLGRRSRRISACRFQRAVFRSRRLPAFTTNVGEDDRPCRFANNNLYVMKFCRVARRLHLLHQRRQRAYSLFCRANAYLDKRQRQRRAVVIHSRTISIRLSRCFLGIAPSYDDYCGMGWYPKHVSSTAGTTATRHFGLFYSDNRLVHQYRGKSLRWMGRL